MELYPLSITFASYNGDPIIQLRGAGQAFMPVIHFCCVLYADDVGIYWSYCRLISVLYTSGFSAAYCCMKPVRICVTAAVMNAVLP